MFCPKCGNDNPKKTIFCRNCGYELPELKETVENKDYLNKIKKLLNTNFLIIAALSLFCSFFAIYLGNYEDFKNKYEFVRIILLIVSIILIGSTFLEVFSKFYLKKLTLENKPGEQKTLEATQNYESLPEADYSHRVPASVVENTTRKLKEKIIKEN
jgi:hypothetical protein